MSPEGGAGLLAGVAITVIPPRWFTGRVPGLPWDGVQGPQVSVCRRNTAAFNMAQANRLKQGKGMGGSCLGLGLIRAWVILMTVVWIGCLGSIRHNSGSDRWQN